MGREGTEGGGSNGRGGDRSDEGLRISAKGRLCRASGEEVCSREGLGVIGEMFWRAIKALAVGEIGGVPVVQYAGLKEEERKTWEGKTFVCPTASQALLDRMRVAAQRWRVQAAWAVDGSFQSSNDVGSQMARAAVRHDGQVVAGALWWAQKGSSFMAEFAAQLDVLAAEGRERILIVFDSTSPVEGMLHFARSHDRHKADFLLDDWYGEWVRLLDKFHVVIFMHVHSHRGAILNEWVDVLAKDAMQADETDVPKSGPREHVSMSFPRPGGESSAGEAAAKLARAQVCRVFAGASVDSVWAAEDDTVPRKGRISDEVEDVLAAVGCARAFASDVKRWPGRVGQCMRGVECVCGHGGGCTWWHAAMECSALQAERCAILRTLKEGENAMGVSMPCDDWVSAIRTMSSGLGILRAGRVVKVPKELSREATDLRRILAGVVKFGESSKAAFGAVENLARVVARWVWEAERLMAPAVRLARERAGEMRLGSVVLRSWRQVVTRRGPIQVAGLRAVSRGWAEAWFVMQAAVESACTEARGVEGAITAVYRGARVVEEVVKVSSAAFAGLRDRSREQLRRYASGSAQPVWVAEQWRAVARIISIRRGVLKERGAGWLEREDRPGGSGDRGRVCFQGSEEASRGGWAGSSQSRWGWRAGVGGERLREGVLGALMPLWAGAKVDGIGEASEEAMSKFRRRRQAVRKDEISERWMGGLQQSTLAAWKRAVKAWRDRGGARKADWRVIAVHWRKCVRTREREDRVHRGARVRLRRGRRYVESARAQAKRLSAAVSSARRRVVRRSEREESKRIALLERWAEEESFRRRMRDARRERSRMFAEECEQGAGSVPGASLVEVEGAMWRKRRLDRVRRERELRWEHRWGKIDMPRGVERGASARAIGLVRRARVPFWVAARMESTHLSTIVLEYKCL